MKFCIWVILFVKILWMWSDTVSSIQSIFVYIYPIVLTLYALTLKFSCSIILSKQPSLHQKVKRFNCIIPTGCDSFPWNQKANKIKRNFFSSDAYFVLSLQLSCCLKSWFVSSTIKLDIMSDEISTSIICVALVIPKNTCITSRIICARCFESSICRFLRNRCFWKLCKIRMKTPGLDSLLNKVTRLPPAILLKRRLRL